MNTTSGDRETTPSRWSYYGPAAAIAAAGCALTYALSPDGPAFPLDDAYIVAHNATVVREGVDRNYVGTPALVGATSPIHLALVVLLQTGLPVLHALQATLWLGVLLYALGLAHLARAHRVPAALAAGFVLAGLLVGRTPHHLLNGLETGLAMAAVAWALALASGGRQRPVLWLLCGTLPFLRPELAVLAIGLAGIPVLRDLQERGRHEAIRALVRAVTLTLVAALPWAVWALLDAGSPLPATAAAKRAWFAEGQLPALTKAAWMWRELVPFLQSLGLATVGLLFLWRSAAGRIGLAFAGAFLGAYWLHLPGALSHNEHRYLYLLVPVLLLGWLHLWAAWPRPRGWIARLALLSLTLQAAITAPAYWQDHAMHRTLFRDELRGVADWCREHLAPGTGLLVHDAGYIAHATDYPLFDLVGLKTPAHISIHEETTYATGGTLRNQAIERIVRQSGARHMIVLDLWNGIFDITGGLERLGWTTTDLRKTGAYRVWHLTPPDPVPAIDRKGIRAPAAPLLDRH